MVVEMNVLIAKSNNLGEFKDLLPNFKPIIGHRGGRYYQLEGEKTLYTLNDIVRNFEKIIQNPSPSTDSKKIKSVIKEIRKLDQSAQSQLQEKSLTIKIATYIRQFFGNLFFDKNKFLNKIQFPEQTLATSVGNYRLLPLEGEKGTVSCRVRGLNANDVPAVSEKGVVEFYERTIPRMRNLVAVRGFEEGARMIGPCDYFGNIERPYENEYTIQIDDGIPAFIQHKKKIEKSSKEQANQNPLPLPPATKLQAEWITGSEEDISSINENVVGESLFKRKGILKIAGGKAFELNKFDAREVDLKPFKARLVKNDSPFQVSNKIISPTDDYRVVSYFYESGYADRQVKNGGGLFLETHSFPQTMTPMDENSAGFVTLAKWSDESKREELEVIAVEIPFGYTLVVEEYCIHGDTNLDGMFTMCMTSSHASMQTADTVFLKNSEGRENVSLSIKGNEPKLGSEEKRTCGALPPIVQFNK